MAGNRRSSLVGAFLLIALGLLFLYSNVRPGLDPWPLLSRYWPALLVFLGLGKLWDQFGPQDGVRKAWLSGREIAVILLLVIFGIALSFSRASGKVHDVQAVDRQGSGPVRVHIQMPAGDMKLSGGASKLLEADFKYSVNQGKPNVSYQAGQLEITQEGRKFNFGPSENNWDIRLGNDIPMELDIDMGAGQSKVKVGDLAVTRLDMKIGAGQIVADLTGNWKKDLEADVKGGVGNAVILLPEDIGVMVHATGGIGSINANGLKREGDEYTNDLYGKSPVSLRLDISGGVGNIELRPTSAKGSTDF
jgi:hypothetical protein